MSPEWMEPEYTCPQCGRLLDGTDYLYKRGNKIIGCQYCIDQVEAAEEREYME